MSVVWDSHPVALDPLMARRLRRVVWHLVSDAAELNLGVMGQRGIMAQNQEVSHMIVRGAIDQPLASPVMSIPARSMTLHVTGTATTGTLLLPFLAYS
jgi:hypothetical protein